jgi:DNA ligase-1
MPDLQDGESVEVQGSANRPYVLKNVGGVFSCSCPAWRFQSLPIERRTCRHLRAWRGEKAEAARIGAPVPARPKAAPVIVRAPPLLLAETWDRELDPTGYWLSEKLDGVRALWTGTHFVSRQGHRYGAPAWFTARPPLEPLDGELWIGRKQFQRTVGIVRRQDESELWKEVRYVVFDAPADESPFEKRLQWLDVILKVCQPSYTVAHPHIVCAGPDHLHQELARMEALGGEGLMLRQPGSRYVAGRSSTLLKVKTFHEAEARVIGYEPGTGRHRGRMGALLVEMANGTRFCLGTGFPDAQRERPPLVGTVVQFKYQELTDGGVPRFPSFLGVRADSAPLSLFAKGESSMSTITSKRRFEFVGGNSDKFWEVAVHGNEVVVHFGRNGTSGQTETKTFADATTAAKHADQKIAEKIKKGYVEIQ